MNKIIHIKHRKKHILGDEYMHEFLLWCHAKHVNTNKLHPIEESELLEMFLDENDTEGIPRFLLQLYAAYKAYFGMRITLFEFIHMVSTAKTEMDIQRLRDQKDEYYPDELHKTDMQYLYENSIYKDSD